MNKDEKYLALDKEYMALALGESITWDGFRFFDEDGYMIASMRPCLDSVLAFSLVIKYGLRIDQNDQYCRVESNEFIYIELFKEHASPEHALRYAITEIVVLILNNEKKGKNNE